HFSATVAFEFTRYSRWRAIHSCRDFADCFPGLAIPGNRATLFQRKLFIFLSHRNTLYKRCCTSFVNLGNPAFFAYLALALPRERQASLRLNAMSVDDLRCDAKTYSACTALRTGFYERTSLTTRTR